MKPELQKTILEKWALSPDDPGLRNNLIRLIQSGKIAPGEGSDGYWLEQYGELRHEYDELERKLSALKRQKTRNTFHPDNRVQVWKASVAAAFEQRTCDTDENGFKIAWAVRERALEWFRAHLFHLATVDLTTLRTITLAMAKGADLTGMLGTSTRAGPPAVDWKKVRDKLQK